VDLDARVLERWCPADERPEILAGTFAWQPRSDIAPLLIDLVSYFAEVLD
jgi:hypothetical protein